jgi:hypothetical protein
MPSASQLAGMATAIQEQEDRLKSAAPDAFVPFPRNRTQMADVEPVYEYDLSLDELRKSSLNPFLEKVADSAQLGTGETSNSHVMALNRAAPKPHTEPVKVLASNQLQQSRTSAKLSRSTANGSAAASTSSSARQSRASEDKKGGANGSGGNGGNGSRSSRNSAAASNTTPTSAAAAATTSSFSASSSSSSASSSHSISFSVPPPPEASAPASSPAQDSPSAQLTSSASATPDAATTLLRGGDGVVMADEEEEPRATSPLRRGSAPPGHTFTATQRAQQAASPQLMRTRSAASRGTTPNASPL